MTEQNTKAPVAIDRTVLRDALDKALDKENPVYKNTSLKSEELKAKNYPPEVVAGLFIHELAPQIKDVLALEPEFQKHPNMMISSGNGATGFSADVAAGRLIGVALKVGTENAINWLNKILKLTETTGIQVLAIWGVDIKEKITLSENIELLPFNQLPASNQKNSFEQKNLSFTHIFQPALIYATPPAAIMSKTLISPVLLEEGGALKPNNWQEVHNLINEACLCLTLFGPSPPVACAGWLQYEDCEIEDAGLGSGAFYPGSELSMPVPPTPQLIDIDSARKLVPLYLKLTGTLKDKVSLALARLNQAMRRRSVGDKALDLTIALEVLVGDTNGDSLTDIGWKISFRTAILVGGSIETQVSNRAFMKALYTMRSNIVHTGKIEQTVKVSGMGKIASDEVAQVGIQLCSKVISAIIELGEIPNWSKFELQHS